MLVLKRREGQWVDIVHRSGDTLRVRVYNIRARDQGQLDLAFDDDARHFAIERPERASRQIATEQVSLQGEDATIRRV